MSVAISLNGHYMVSGDAANNLTLFDQTGYVDNYTLSDSVSSVAMSDNGYVQKYTQFQT